ncbi:Oidioi.mRNA.OKI2018_I69.XSR.g16375.t1.cds [Oikopleura dioica]|uniref:Oidioi.mRNA.OKI2018_I69.XSR.g16375.t1.cds n=1 Tax=Oikopleura dioica TaxID=34765 RepID=A0ABN7SQ93_OIKDI|nr:Oidioi.mRNA.OKI2018_I69.XSR.g16375.t1.cds [Oikopleura dioica]
MTLSNGVEAGAETIELLQKTFKTKTKNGNGKMARSLELERRHYFRKAMGLLAVGIGIIALGIAFSVLYFLNRETRKNIMMAGPICLAVGLLVFICAMVWIPIIKTKLKKKMQQQKSQNRYGI